MRPTIEPSHGKPRVIPVRLSDIEGGRPDEERRRDRDALGRYTHRNRGGAAKGAKRTVRATVPHAGRSLFVALLRGLGDAGRDLSVQLEVAARVRHELAAAELHDAARAVGLATAEGAKLDARSCEHTELALRAATAAEAFARQPAPTPHDRVAELRAAAERGTP